MNFSTRYILFLTSLIVLFTQQSIYSQTSTPTTNNTKRIHKRPVGNPAYFDSKSAESSVITKPKQGNLKVDKPEFPSFYLWKCASKTTPREGYGSFMFEVYLINKNGELIKKDVPGQKYPSSEGGLFDKQQYSKLAKWDSFDGNWTCSVDDFMGNSFRLSNNSTQQNTEVLRPRNDIPNDSCMPLGWSPQKNYFYFKGIEGDTTGRYETLFQFDPTEKKYVEISGMGWHFNISPDGKWVVWSEGAANQVGGAIHVYSVENNTDYILPSDSPYNVFYKWCYADTEDKKRNVDSYIKNGKQLFLKKQFIDAIQEYQKAINIDPANSLAYGYMGYSEFRMGSIKSAILNLEKSTKFDSSNKLSFLNLALAYWANNQKDLAISSLRPIYYLNRKLIYDDPQFKEILTSPEFQKAF